MELPNRKNPRASWWDYTNYASYFITICTKDKAHYFGEIIQGVMILSKVGVIADLLWYELKNRFSHIEFDDFVVMPNHIHAILTLTETDKPISVSTIVGGYKSAVTKHCNRLKLDMIWQSRFYDSIIRNEEMYNNIKNYIQNNPILWEKDKFYP